MRRLRYSAVAGSLSVFLCLFGEAGGAAERGPDFDVDAVELLADDYVELIKFTDDLFEDALSRYRVPGAVIAVVHDQDVVALRGYGWSDLEKELPAHPTKTRFRVGSVSKIFTTVTVMQLLDDGLVSFDRDVSEYLTGWNPTWRFRDPVTLRHLLTHTSGIDARFVGIAARETELDVSSLGAHLESFWPNQSHRPGEFAAYSNYGYALLGHVVASLRKERFASVMQSKVLDPMSMTSSRFGFTSASSEGLARGYRLVDAQLAPLEFERYHIQPASSLVTTASDMAKFIVAFWEDDSRLLSEASRAEMMKPQFRHHPRLAGRGYGFHERFLNGERVLAHAGGLRGFSSYLAIWPERKWGLFFAVNRFDESLREAWVQGVASRIQSERNDTVARVPMPDALAANLAGAYQSLRYKSSVGFEKVMTLFSADRLEPTKDGAILFHSFGNDSPPKFWLQPDGTLSSRTDERRMAYRVGERGAVTHVYLGSESFEKLSWLDQPAPNRKAFQWFFVAFAALGGFWLVVSILRRFTRPKRTASALSWSAGTLVGLQALFLIGLGVVGSRVDPADYLFGMPVAMKAVLSLPIVACGVTAFCLWLISFKASRQTLTRLDWIGVPLSLTLSLTFLTFLHHWRLLGFRF